MNYTQRALCGTSNFNDTVQNHKWFLSKYAALSSGFVFYKGGHATVFSAPVGLQLNRRLNSNFYAFAGVYVAPAYINFSYTFLSADIDKSNLNNRFIKSNNLGMYERAYLGLMYTNDAKTFSISGSIGIEQTSNPVFQYRQFNKPVQNQVVAPSQQ